jgi:hypothetical protein
MDALWMQHTHSGSWLAPLRCSLLPLWWVLVHACAAVQRLVHCTACGYVQSQLQRHVRLSVMWSCL